MARIIESYLRRSFRLITRKTRQSIGKICNKPKIDEKRRSFNSTGKRVKLADKRSSRESNRLLIQKTGNSWTRL